MNFKNNTKTKVEKQVSKLYTVFDLEFYGIEPQHRYGNLKQMGVIVFNEKYEVVEIFDTTFIDEAGQRDAILKKVDELMRVSEINFAWGCHQDIKTMHDFGFDLSRYTIVDMQSPFLHHTKQNTLGGTYYKITGDRMIGAHNALIDAKYTLKLIELFDLARPGGVEQLEVYAKYLLRGSKVYGDLNGLSSEDRQMIKQLGTLIQSKCKASAYNQLDKVIVMLNERVEDGILDIDFVREKKKIL